MSTPPPLSYNKVLDDFFTTLGPLDLGNSMQQFTDALRIINGKKLTNDWIFNNVNIKNSYNHIISLIFPLTGKIYKDNETYTFAKIDGPICEIPTLYVKLDEGHVKITITMEEVPGVDGGESTIKYDVSYLKSSFSYKNVVKSALESLLDPDVYALYTSEISHLKGISIPDDAKLFIFKTPLYDVLMDFVLYGKLNIDNESDSSQLLSTEVTEVTEDSRLVVYEHLRNIDIFLHHMKTNENTSEDFNHLIMKVNDNQNNITQYKESIKQVKEKMYTLMSRDVNYTRVLGTHKRQYYIFMMFLIIISIVHGFALISKKISPKIRNNVVVTVAVTVFVIQIMTQLFGIVNSRAKETFTTTENKIISSGIHLATTATSKNIILVGKTLANYVTEYNKFMSHEIKTEYYDSITEKQKNDQEMLKQLHKENENQKIYHELKNSLTYFKINEMKEYNRLVSIAVTIVSMLAILYLAVLNQAIEYDYFKVIAVLALVLYGTYLLLAVKSIMIRDQYDWDRMNWKIGTAFSPNNQVACKLPGR